MKIISYERRERMDFPLKEKLIEIARRLEITQKRFEEGSSEYLNANRNFLVAFNLVCRFSEVFGRDSSNDGYYKATSNWSYNDFRSEPDPDGKFKRILDSDVARKLDYLKSFAPKPEFGCRGTANYFKKIAELEGKLLERTMKEREYEKIMEFNPKQESDYITFLF